MGINCPDGVTATHCSGVARAGSCGVDFGDGKAATTGMDCLDTSGMVSKLMCGGLTAETTGFDSTVDVDSISAFVGILGAVISLTKLWCLGGKTNEDTGDATACGL